MRSHLHAGRDFRSVRGGVVVPAEVAPLPIERQADDPFRGKSLPPSTARKRQSELHHQLSAVLTTFDAKRLHQHVASEAVISIDAIVSSPVGIIRIYPSGSRIRQDRLKRPNVVSIVHRGIVP